LQDFEESNWRNLDFRDVLETFTYSEYFHLSPKGSSIGGEIFDKTGKEFSEDIIT
jgi:hypothetical protein